jgi:hypothetical protein
MVARVRAGPGADHFVHLVAGYGVRTAVSEDAWGLFRELLGWIHEFGFQRNLAACVLAVLGLAHVPGSLCHTCLLTTLQVYRMSDRPTSDTRHGMA